MLSDILTGLCLVLVFEGVLPFLNPQRYKSVIRAMLEVDEERIRWMGLCSMIVGVVLLAIVR